MANTIRLVSRLDYRNSSGTILRSTPQRTYEVETTSELVVDNTQVVTTTHELVAAGDATDDCVAVIENLSTTATVLVGGDSGGSFVEWFSIPPNYPPAIIPQVGALASTYLKSSTGSVNVRVTLYKVAA